MTIYYIDPEGGDDTKDGKSFANRWRTLKGTQTTPVVQGDELRFMASKPSYSIGTATFVDNTEFFTLTAWDTKLKTIDRALDNTGWVKAAAPMVLTALTSSKTSTDMTGIQYPNPGTYSGKLFHKTLPSTLDLSAFTHVTLLLTNGGSYSTQATLHLCSDTSGDVPLVSLAIPKFRGEVAALLGQEGVPLPSGVRSVSISVAANPKNSGGIYGLLGIENIMACLAPSNPNHISHGCLFAVEDADGYKEWLPIRALIDAQVYIGGLRPNLGTPHPMWRGTPGVKEVHLLQPVKPRWLLRYENVLKGKSAVTITGGWSRTDMATQDGVSWYSGEYARMFNGGEASIDPDNAESAADDYQLLWDIQGIDGESVFPKTSGFGFAHYVDFPLRVRNFVEYNLVFDLAGLVGLVNGLRQIGARSVHKVRQVSYCCDGLYYSPPASNPSLLAPLGALDTLEVNIGVLSYAYRELVLPTSNLLTNRSVLVGKLHGSVGGIRTDRGPGVFRLRNTVFQYNDFYDLIAHNTCWLEGCTFLAANGELAEPKVNFGAYGLAIHMDRTNGNAWDTRTYTRYPGFSFNNVARVRDTIYRVPGMRSMELEGGLHGDTPMRAQVALIPVRANTPVQISGYLKQQYPAPEFGGAHNTWLTVLPGYLPGVELQRHRNLRSIFGWCRVVFDITSEVDGLLPIFLESDFGKGWATEIKLDESGLPPSPPFNPDPNTWTITDTLTFTAEPEDVMGYYDSWSGGTATARDAFASVLGVTINAFTASTLSNKMGKVGGVCFLNAKDGVSGCMLAILLEPGWNETYPIEQTFLRLRDGAGAIVKEFPYQSPGVSLGSPYDGWQYFGGADAGQLALVNQAAYTVEVIRPPLE